MNAQESAVAVVDALIELDIPYMIVGSLSSNQYGIPRSTEDADFVIELGTRSVGEIARRLGPNFRLDPQMSFDTFTGTRRHEVTVRDSLFRVELFILGDDPHDQERFRRRLPLDVLGRRVYFPTPEDVILTKLRWARNKDRDDVRDVLAVQGEALDWGYIHEWCERHGTRALLDEIRTSIPPI